MPPVADRVHVGWHVGIQAEAFAASFSDLQLAYKTKVAEATDTEQETLLPAKVGAGARRWLEDLARSFSPPSDWVAPLAAFRTRLS